jgi:hypothetical protein
MSANVTSLYALIPCTKEKGITVNRWICISQRLSRTKENYNGPDMQRELYKKKMHIAYSTFALPKR